MPETGHSLQECADNKSLRIIYLFRIFGKDKDGWLLLYKRLAQSRFMWPRNADEVQALTQQQFRWLMEGLTITPKKSIKEAEPPEYMG